MKKQLIFTTCKKPGFILILILAAFFLKGVILSSVFGIFSGQDEARHYNTVQFLAEPTNVERNNYRKLIEKKEVFSDYNFSEEIKNAGIAAGVDSLKTDIFNTVEFSDSYNGKNEPAINAKTWKPYNLTTPADITYGGIQFYHKLAALLEKAFTNQDMLFRFYLIRIFSVLLGTSVILLSYLIARTIGFSAKHALLLAAIVSFQPKFSMYSASINYDVLAIPMFTLFTWAGILTLKKGLNWKNGFLFFASITIAVLTKPTGYIMLVPLAFLLAYLLYIKVQTKNKKTKYIAYIFSLISFLLLANYLKNYLSVDGNSISHILTSINDYFSKSLSIGRLALSSRTYWGTLDWTNNWFMEHVTDLIWFVQAFAITGIGIFFFSKKKFSFLPEKKYVAFLIGMIVSLQLGIRAADWSVFNQFGSISLGAPGRYFLPNTVSHIILVFIGLGALFSCFKKEKYLDYSLIIGLILMLGFSMYLIFDTIIYRFYL